METDRSAGDDVSHLAHVSFYQAASLSRQAATVLSLNMLITWAKMLEYLSVFPYMALLSHTLQTAAYEVMCFLILFFMAFIGCGQAFMMTYGPYMGQYSTLGAFPYSP